MGIWVDNGAVIKYKEYMKGEGFNDVLIRKKKNQTDSWIPLGSLLGNRSFLETAIKVTKL